MGYCVANNTKHISYKKFKDTVTNYYTSKHEKYTPFAQDIFTAIEDGSRTWADYRKNKKSMPESDFRMEVMNEIFSENEDSYFDYKSFKENQTLTQAAKLPTLKNIFSGQLKSLPEKQNGEIRLVISDLAFSGNNSREKNDNTVFMCMSLHWKDFRFERHVDYIETRPGGGADKTVLRLKELFHDYEADYLVMDNRGGGETIFDYLSAKTPHPNRGIWNDSGFTVVNEKDLWMASEGKNAELASRTIDKNAIPCLISVISTSESNSKGLRSEMNEKIFFELLGTPKAHRATTYE